MVNINHFIDHKCERPNIAVFDHGPHNGNMMVNRVCLTCKQHWYGPEGNVVEYTGQEWNRLVERDLA